MDMNQEINTTINTNAKHICSVGGYMDSSNIIMLQKAILSQFTLQ